MELEMQWDGNPSIILDIKTYVGVALPVQVISFTICCSDSPKMLPHPFCILQNCTTFGVSDTHPLTFMKSQSYILSPRRCARTLTASHDIVLISPEMQILLLSMWILKLKDTLLLLDVRKPAFIVSERACTYQIMFSIRACWKGEQLFQLNYCVFVSYTCKLSHMICMDMPVLVCFCWTTHRMKS